MSPAPWHLNPGRTCKDAARRPHVHGWAIGGAAKQQLRSSVPARKHLHTDLWLTASEHFSCMFCTLSSACFLHCALTALCRLGQQLSASCATTIHFFKVFLTLLVHRMSLVYHPTQKEEGSKPSGTQPQASLASTRMR